MLLFSWTRKLRKFHGDTDRLTMQWMRIRVERMSSGTRLIEVFEERCSGWHAKIERTLNWSAPSKVELHWEKPIRVDHPEDRRTKATVSFVRPVSLNERIPPQDRQRHAIEWDSQERRSSWRCHCCDVWSSDVRLRRSKPTRRSVRQEFRFDASQDGSPVVDEEETIPIGDGVCPEEIQWQTRRFPEKWTESALPRRDDQEERERRVLLVHRTERSIQREWRKWNFHVDRSIPTGNLHNNQQDDSCKTLDTSLHWREDCDNRKMKIQSFADEQNRLHWG